ncbi:hypothetical protein [Actinoallomurus sp. NPDC052274]|uniref:hypothetical protein n=1 Tax=Actinoallomurus sp. NPDC052274 TaxID=3155420 RepID=UPI003426E72B
MTESILWIGGDPADDRVRRAREFVFRFHLERVTAEETLGQARMRQRDHYGQAAARGDADLVAEARRRLHSLP